MLSRLHGLFVFIAVSITSPGATFSLLLLVRPPQSYLLLLLLLTVNHTLPVAASSKAINVTTQPEDAYQRFLEVFGLWRQRAEEGRAVLEHRRALFHARSAEVDEHNSRPGVTWMAEVNHFADSTEEERQARLGYKPTTATHWRRARSPGFASPAMQAGVAAAGEAMAVRKLESAVDWSRRLPQSATRVRDQGMCGSCWAVAAVGALEMHAEFATGKSPVLSYMNLVDCVPNPHHCGGTGGCNGATAELAFEYVKNHGIVENSAYAENRYRVTDACAYPWQQQMHYLTVDNFVQLPVNQVAPALQALANVGPMVAALDANNLFSYKSGVFNFCPLDAIVNHAVLLVGYGQTKGTKYWRLRNSWGQQWGEDGYFNLLRHDNDDDWCGIDKWPQEGSGCDGGPGAIPVCGMCGVLADLSYPVGVRIVEKPQSESKVSLHSVHHDHEGRGNLRRRTWLEGAQAISSA